MAGVEGINFTYDQDKGMFYGPLPLQPEQDEKYAQQQMVSTPCLLLAFMKRSTLLVYRTQFVCHKMDGFFRVMFISGVLYC